MAAIARWLIDNASSGVMSGVIVDDTGNGNNLTIDNANSDGSWTSVAAGNGLTANAAGKTSGSMIAELADIVANGNIGSALNNATQASIILVADLDNTAPNEDHVFHLGTYSGNGDLNVQMAAKFQVRWNNEAGGGYVRANNYPSGLSVIHIIIDTAQAVAADRIKIYYNNALQGQSVNTITQNDSLTAVNDTGRYVSLFNRPTQNRNARGSLYFAELHDAALTAQEISDSYTALIANNDANWVAPPDTIAPVFTVAPIASNPTQVGHDISTTLDEDGTIYAVRLASGSAAPSSAQVKAGQDSTGSPAFEAQNVAATASVQASMTFNGASASTSYDYYVVAEDDEATPNIQVSPALVSATTAAPAFIIDSISAGPYYAGDSITLNVSNANATGKTASIQAGALIVTAQDVNTITITVPDPKIFGTKTTRYNTDIVITVDDAGTQDAITFQISPNIGHDYVETVALTGINDAISAPGLDATDNAYGYFETGTGTSDLANGAIQSDAGAIYRVWYQDETDGIWGDYADHTLYGPAPANLVSIDVVTTSKTSAIVEFSYSGVDVTSYEYNIGAGWLVATSPLTINGLTAATLYNLDIRPMLNGSDGTVTSTSFTTDAAVDATPSSFSLAAQTGVPRSVYVTSNTITVQGVDAGLDIPVSVSGGEYSVSTDNGATWGVWTTTATNVRLNYQIRVRHLTAATYLTGTTTTLDIGGVIGSFTSTTLADTVAPIISLVGGNQTIVQGDTWTEPGYSAVDNNDGDITADVVVVNNIDSNIIGTYTATYDVTDAAGNVAIQAVRTIYVVVATSNPIDQIQYMPAELSTNRQNIVIYQGRGNRFSIAIAHKGIPIDLTAFIRFELIGLSATPIDSNTYSNAFDWDNGNGEIVFDIGALITVQGITNTTLIGYSTADPEGIVLWHEDMQNSSLSVNVINA